MRPSRLSDFAPKPEGRRGRVRDLRWRHGLADLEFPSRQRWQGCRRRPAQARSSGACPGRAMARACTTASIRRARMAAATMRAVPISISTSSAIRQSTRSARLQGEEPSDPRAAGDGDRRRPLSRHHAVRRRLPRTAWMCSSSASRARSRARCSTSGTRTTRSSAAKGDELYFHTTKDAPNARVIAVNPKHPEPAAWRAVIPAADMALEVAHFVGGRIIAQYLENAHNLVRLFETSGKAVRRSAAAGPRHDRRLRRRARRDTETFFSYADYVTPDVDLSLRAGDQYGHALAQGRPCPANTDAYVTEQVFYNSKDGTRVPMFITHKRDMKKDGNQPTLLYGYGGFNVAATPTLPRAVPGVAGDGRRPRGGEHPRRRRVRRGVAPRRHAQSRSRTCSMISSRRRSI